MRWAIVVCLLATGCTGRDFDSVTVCFPQSTDRIVVEARVECASDHRGAKLSCDVSVVGMNVRVTTHGHDGRDPDDVCADELTARCESPPLADGVYTVDYGDETFEVDVPNTDDSSCVPPV